jgi:transcriptional regulator with XRE-family HTH domain
MIRALRRRKGMTAEQLAKKAGVSEKTVRLLEKDQTDTPHPETICAIAGSLGVLPENLFIPLLPQEPLTTDIPSMAPVPERYPSASPELAEPLGYAVVRDHQHRLLFRYRMIYPQTTIGRGFDNIINLSDTSVSEYHAAIHLGGGQIQIRDLGSTNGVYLNGTRIQGRAAFTWGEDIAIGPYHIELMAPGTDPGGFPAHPTDLMRSDLK